MRRLAGIAALALALAAPLPAAGAPPQWRPVDAATGEVRDVDGLEALAEAFPDSGSVRLRLLQALIGEGERALAVLRWLGERGYVFSERAREQIPRLIGEDHAEAAKALLLPEAEAMVASAVIARTPAEAGLVESIAAIPGGDGFLAPSISRGSVFALSPGDDCFEIPLPLPAQASGIVTDDRRGIAWVALGNVAGGDAAADGFSGLFGMLEDFNQSLLVPAPAGVTVSDLALGPDGTVYASNPLGGGIYRAGPGDERLAALVEPGTLRSPQGLAPSADGARLYVSDYRYGLAMIDLASGEVSRLASDVPAILDGIDGLWLHRGELVAVQNGTSPMRISAFALSADGSRITGVRVLEQANPEWTEPLGGSIVSGALVYVGTGHWGDYVAGELAEGREAKPTEIRRLPLGPATKR